MRFIADAVLESRAAELWRRFQLKPGFDVEALIDDVGLSLLWEEAADPEGLALLGYLDPGAARIVLNQSHLGSFNANPGLHRFTVAHELGHWLFHAEPARLGSLSLFRDGRIWCRDGSRHPAERQADKFAGRLLIPRDVLRPELPTTTWQGWPTVYSLAHTFVVSATAMIVRLEELGWAHRDEDGTPRAGASQVAGQTNLFPA